MCITLFQVAIADICPANENCVYRDAAPQTALAGALRRGVNLSGWWEKDRHNQFSERDFRNIRDMGFDFVRIPVTPEWLEIKDKHVQAETLRNLRCNIISILNNHLAVVLDLHPDNKARENMNTMSPDMLQAYLLGVWKAATPLLKDIPANRIALNLLNEPDIQLRSYWWKVQGGLVSALRGVYPHHLLIVSSIQNGPWNYTGAEPYVDANLMYDFHFYQPMFLTHHAADWVKSYNPSEKKENVTYPVANSRVPPDASAGMKDYIMKGWNKDVLAAEMAPSLQWAKRSGVRLICLEFGVYRPYVSTQSRGNWLRDMRDILESRHIPWAVWEYNEGFGILESGRDADAEIRSSLGLSLNHMHNVP